MTEVELLPPGPELAWRNRRLMAARGRWPDGALEVCEEIETAHPDWSVGWRSENTIRGFESPAGFYADRRHSRRHLERALYGPRARSW